MFSRVAPWLKIILRGEFLIPVALGSRPSIPDSLIGHRARANCAMSNGAIDAM